MAEHNGVETLRSILKEKAPTVFYINRYTEELSFEFHFGRQQFVTDMEQLQELVNTGSLPVWIVNRLQEIGLIGNTDDPLPMPE